MEGAARHHRQSFPPKQAKSGRWNQEDNRRGVNLKVKSNRLKSLTLITLLRVPMEVSIETSMEYRTYAILAVLALYCQFGLRIGILNRVIRGKCDGF